MALRENFSGYSYLQVIPPQAATGDVTGADVDMQGYEAVTFVVNTGGVTGSIATTGSYWKIRMQEADVSTVASTAGTYANVAASAMLRTNSDAVTSGIVQTITTSVLGSTIAKFGYRGAKRFVRVFIEEVGTMSGLLVGGAAVQYYANNWPVNAVNQDAN